MHCNIDPTHKYMKLQTLRSQEELARGPCLHVAGSWHDIHDKPIIFDVRRFHQAEPHEGHMWALAAYMPPAFKWLSNENASKLTSLGLPILSS